MLCGTLTGIFSEIYLSTHTGCYVFNSVCTGTCLGGGGLHTYVHILRDGVYYDMGAEYASRAHVQCCHGLGGLIWDNFSIEQSYIH
jgi:hypothetical protein